jgi:hypothetical protein
MENNILIHMSKIGNKIIGKCTKLESRRNNLDIAGKTNSEKNR